jgi:acetyl esterase/lipase
MYAFLPKKRSTSAAILIIPGGGYEHVALGHEGLQLAAWLMQQGMASFVLDYRVKPYLYPVQIDDGRRAMRLIRAHAAEYGIDPTRIGVWGSSAGGHLASSLGTHCENVTATATNTSSPEDQLAQTSCKPDFMVLAYPVISMEGPFVNQESQRYLLGPHPDPALEHEYSNQFAVTANTPPTFLFATTNDHTVPVENSLDFYRALVQAQVPVEMHLFDYSDHGCGLCGSILPLRVWPALLRTWLIDRSLLPPDAPPLPAPEPNWTDWPAGFTGPGQD